MYRLLNFNKLYQNNVRKLPSNISFPVTNLKQEGYSCSFCKKLLEDPIRIENALQIRHRSTNTALSQRVSKKKKNTKIFRKYAEVLAVNGDSTNETQVSVSKLRADQLSKLASDPDMSLEHLHQLTTPQKSVKQTQVDKTTTFNLEIALKDVAKARKVKKKPAFTVDSELLKDVENAIMNGYDKKFEPISLKEDDYAIIFVSENSKDLHLTFRDKKYLDMIKESYNKFRKATLRDQRLKDLNCAINEGLNQNFDVDIGKTSITLKENVSQQKGAHEIFRECLAEEREMSSVHNFGDIQMKSGAIPAYEELNEESEWLDSEPNIREHFELEDADITQSIPMEVAVENSEISRTPRKKNKKISKKQEAQKEKLSILEKKGKEDALNKLLAAHLELCSSLGYLQKGYQILMYYRSQGKRFADQPLVKDVNLYNILIQGYGAKGDHAMVCNLLKHMKEDDIARDIGTYIGIFHCIEMLPSDTKYNLRQKYFTDLKAQKISVNDILDKGKFLGEQRGKVLSAIGPIQPSYTPPELDYICPLLTHLNIKNGDENSRSGLALSPARGLLSNEDLISRLQVQLDSEIKGEILVENIEVKGEPTDSTLLYRKKLTDTENEWRQVIKEAFDRNLIALKSQNNACQEAIKMYLYLQVLDVNEFVDIVLNEVRNLSSSSEMYSPALKTLQCELGSQVYARYQVKQKQKNGTLDKLQNIYKKYCQWYIERTPSIGVDGQTEHYNSRQKWQQLVHQHREGASLDIEDNIWPNSICEKVGKLLYNIILNEIKIDVNIIKPNCSKEKKLPVFYMVQRCQGFISRFEIKPHPVLVRLVRLAAPPHLHMRSTLVPSLVPPVPWSRAAKGAHGGYLLTRTPIVRMPWNVCQQWKRLAEAPVSSLYPALDSLNQLGAVPWVINKPILDIMLNIFRSGGSKDLKVARPPSALTPDEIEIRATNKEKEGQTEGNDNEEKEARVAKANMFRHRAAVKRARAEMYSLWCDMLYKLSLANHYRDRVFWLPHNLDFRGRVYACPPHLTNLGGDATRALLHFARAEPLGPRGLRWLMLHCVNLTGTVKKKTIDQRVEYAESLKDEFLDSADNPLSGRRWWVKSDDPWQTLACCMEIANALRSPNPEEYLCRFPVHQDGSCNGLQHYAALGGDAAGAKAVNLTASHAPQDVYSSIVALVEEARVRDAAAGVASAIVLDGFVQRKVIKQTVMTTVYGVTRFGARLQIAKQLKDIADFPKEHVWQCSNYLTSKTFESLQEMFTSTKQIQDWFTECAKVISGECGESVEWVTPLGLPVVQPYYRRTKSAPTGSNSQHLRTTIDLHERPCTMKQRNAFPPNYIHSLDSSHMMLTGVACEAAGLTFVSVHDCFWTHPNTVDLMNKICRQQFVALHSQPILEDLSKYLVSRYAYDERELNEGSDNSAVTKRKVNSILKQLPRKGNFQLENVLQSIYFFS